MFKLSHSGIHRGCATEIHLALAQDGLLSLPLHKAVLADQCHSALSALLAEMTRIRNIKIKNKASGVKICLIPIYKTCKMP
ncbi:hypothetical protein KXJ74_11725 [Acinetobacter johnsonii]|nr:hypothetical protein KXJ74_11725 [Acinetobacter johnsonii]